MFSKILISLAAILSFFFLLYIIDLFLLSLESKGYIYYRKRHGSTDRVGSFLLDISTFVDPSKKYVIEQQKSVIEDSADPSDSPEPLGDLPDDTTVDQSKENDAT